jgi:hypothetical protein
MKDGSDARADTLLTIKLVPCLWGVNDDLSTRFVSPAFARLVGVGRLLLIGQPWFMLLANANRAALESLVRSPLSGPAAVVEIRHVEGGLIPVALRRISGGRGRDTAVLTVVPILDQESAAAHDQGKAALFDQ